MKKSWLLTFASMIMVFACVAKADVAWEENFDPIKTTWAEPTAFWTDLAGTTAKLTEYDPNQVYGVAVSEVITVDIGKYSELVIVSTAVDSGVSYSVQIQDACNPGVYADAVSYIGAPGTQIVNIAALMGWSGVKSFVINVWIDGDNKGATFDLLQLREPEVTEGWLEDFDPIKTTWVQTSATWTDLAGATAKLTESDPVNSYGDATTEVITVDVNQYNELVISSIAMDPNALYSIQIQEVGGAGAYANAVSFMGVPSTQVVDIAKLMGWTGVKSFVINVWIDGDNKGVTFGRLEIRQSQQMQAAWDETFDPIKLTWNEESCYWTDTAGQGAVLTENNPSGQYGVVRSEFITVDVNVYNELYIKVSAIAPGSNFSVQLIEMGGAIKDPIRWITLPGTYIVDLRSDLVGWSGTKTFQINIWLDGEGLSTTVDKIKVRSNVVAQEPTDVFWLEDFDPIKETWIEIGAYWTDNGDSTATVTEDQPGVSYGKVESETIDANVSVYPEVTVVVTETTATKLDVQIQEQGGNGSYGNVIAGINAPGVYKGSIPATMVDGLGQPWTGQHTFRIVLWVNGNGKSTTIDSIKLGMDCGIDVLAGDYNEDCEINFYDLVVIGESWMNAYNTLDLSDIAGNWLEKLY